MVAFITSRPDNKSDDTLGVEEEATKIDSNVQGGISASNDHNTRKRRRQFDPSISDTESDSPGIECDVFLDRPLAYCQSSRFVEEKDFQASDLFESSVDVGPVAWSRLGHLSNNQTFGLVQLLYKAAISTRAKRRKLELDLLGAKRKQKKIQNQLQAEAAVHRKETVRKDKRYKALQKLCAQSQSNSATVCPICYERDVNRSLECGHLLCADCVNSLENHSHPNCPFCRKPRGDVRPVYFLHGASLVTSTIILQTKY